MNTFIRSASSWKARSVFLVGALLLLTLSLLARQELERTMSWHMLVQLPLIFCSGVLSALAISGSFCNTGRFFQKAFITACNSLHRCDEHGLTGLFSLLLISAYWMIPKALEESLTLETAEILKFVSLFLLGAILPGSLARASLIAQVFFLGNFCSMSAIVGLLYQDAPQRLCNAYLLDDQIYAGTGLVGISLLVPIIWCVAQVKKRRDQVSSYLTHGA